MSTLRKVFYLFLILITGLGLLQCRKNEADILFKMEYDQVLNVPAGLNTLETYSFVLQNLPTNFQQLITTYNISTTAILAIRPGSIRLRDEFNQFDFGKVERISLLASKPGFINEREIAYLEPVPLASTSTLQLFPTLVDGIEIFSGEKFNLKLKIKLRSFITTNSNIRLQVNMNAVNK